MADTSRERGNRAPSPAPPVPSSIAELIQAGVLDGELAATTWLLLDGRVPLIVASADDDPRVVALIRAFLDLLPDDVAQVELAGDRETFEWLPQASELGWPGVGHAPVRGDPIRPAATVLVGDLSDRASTSTWGKAARVAVRAASSGAKPHPKCSKRADVGSQVARTPGPRRCRWPWASCATGRR